MPAFRPLASVPDRERPEKGMAREGPPVTVQLTTPGALITGSSRGIGRGIGIKLAECGVARIGVHYLKQKDDAEQTVRLIEQRGARAVLIQADVTKPEDIGRMFAEAQTAIGPLGVFVANARPDVQHFYQPVLDLTPEHWRSAIDSQATALLLAAREAAGMMVQRDGRIVVVTYAPGGRTGSWRSWAAMGPAKAAMESLLRYLAWEFAGRGITVNAVSPGATEDSVFSTLPAAVLDMLRDWARDGWVPMRRLTTPADVGDAVALLCSEQAGFITGQTLAVDGGASLACADFPMNFQHG
jgi:NAD(P)-dependent dehydrogenase (short-subunit alcohol dehydrogenase family)